MGDKVQAINVTLYPQHIAIIDTVARDVLVDPRCNRSRALQHVVSEYARLTALEERLKLARRPETPYYAVALKAIEAMETGAQPMPPITPKEIKELLTYGREYESLVPGSLEVVQAYYDRLLARLAQQPAASDRGGEEEA